MLNNQNKRCNDMHFCLCLILSLPILMCGCHTSYPRVRTDKKFVDLMQPEIEIPEHQLFDVRVQIFEPGNLPTSKNAARGLSEIIRKAESTYMAVQLKNTLQQSKNWGAVRTVSAPHAGDEVLVAGRILKSNGEELKLKVWAVDATGKLWFNQTFKSAVAEDRYERGSEQKAAVFQNIYNKIANKLAVHRRALSPEDIQEIRDVAQMQFAEELVPSAFNGYLQRKKGKSPTGFITKLARLPSKNDEFMGRVRRVRGRDYMLVDTLDAHYAGLYREMKPAYTDWRRSRIMEMNAIRKIDDKHNKQVTQGILLTVAGAMLGAAGSKAGGYNPALGSAVGAVVGAGMSLVISADKIKEEAEFNKTALEDLGMSFVAEMKPMTLQLEGKTVTLTGSAEAQYKQWREILATLYKVETEPVSR